MKIDIVVPFFNEEACAEEFAGTLVEALDALSGVTFAYHFVDDGSSDKTADILDRLAAAHPTIRVTHLWGNHGHQRALVAGLDQCDGDGVLMMDGDGQHPVETAVALIETYLKNPDIAVVQALRQGRQHSRWKDKTSLVFYWLINRLVPDIRILPGSSDFRLMSADALDVVRSFSDRYRNLRVLLASLNLPTIAVEYTVDRRIGGTSKYDWGRMLALAADGLFAFSLLPLKISLILMASSGMIGIAYTLYGLTVYVRGEVVPGWTSLIALMALLFSGMFGALAILSEYVSRIYADVRRYPIYRLRPERKTRAGLDEMESTPRSDFGPRK